MPGNDEHPFAGHLNEAGVIGSKPTIGMSVRRFEQSTIESLRRLNRPKTVTVDSDIDTTLIVNTLHRVDNRHSRNDRRVASVDSSRDSDNQLSRHEGACSVMHEDDLDLIRQGKQRQRDGLLTGFATGHDHDFGGQIRFIEQDPDLIDLIWWHRQNNETDRVRSAQRPHRMNEKRRSAEEPECLRRTGPKPFASTGRRNDGRGSPFGAHAGLRGEDLVEDRLGFVLVGLLGESKLAHENLTGLSEHALLSR